MTDVCPYCGIENDTYFDKTANFVTCFKHDNKETRTDENLIKAQMWFLKGMLRTKLKSLCMRCKKMKHGIHEVILFGLPYQVCQRCSTRIMNLSDLYKQTRKQSFKIKLEWLMFHAVGFNEL